MPFRITVFGGVRRSISYLLEVHKLYTFYSYVLFLRVLGSPLIVASVVRSIPTSIMVSTKVVAGTAVMKAISGAVVITYLKNQAQTELLFQRWPLIGIQHQPNLLTQFIYIYLGSLATLHATYSMWRLRPSAG